MVLSAVSYFATGDNPTNYGNNDTRTLTWTASDGSLNVPAGQGQNTATSTITIDAVNDAPVNNRPCRRSPATRTRPAASRSPVSSISDVDADPANQSITVRLRSRTGR